MIRAAADTRALAARLARKAALIARARFAARATGPHRWRRAGWLWPLFAKD